MAGFARTQQDEPITSINVTPLVDIVLVLLIIFMVTAKLVVSRAVPLDLPGAATGAEVQMTFAVSLTTDGRIHINGKPLEGGKEALYEHARTAKRDSPKLRAVLRADGRLPHRQVMAALDALRQADISNVAFAVSAEAPARGAQRDGALGSE